MTEAETKLGVRFPRDYVDAMMSLNGGSVDVEDECWELFPIRDEATVERIRRTCSDVGYETTEARGWEGFPHDAVAIASCGSGNLLVFRRLEGSIDLGETVCRWDHETGGIDEVSERFSMLRKAG